MSPEAKKLKQKKKNQSKTKEERCKTAALGLELSHPTEEDDEESQDEVPNDDDDLGEPAAGADDVDVVGPS